MLLKPEKTRCPPENLSSHELSRLDLKETPMKSDCYGMSSVVRIQFEKNVADVSFYSIFTDIQAVSDNFVGGALGDEFQHLDLSLGQGLLRSVLPKFRGYFGLHVTQPGIDRANRVQEIATQCRFQQIPRRASPQSTDRLNIS